VIYNPVVSLDLRCQSGIWKTFSDMKWILSIAATAMDGANSVAVLVASVVGYAIETKEAAL